MIRRGHKLHTLYPSRLEDHLSSEFGGSEFDICLEACALPRWFNYPMLECALGGILSEKSIAENFERLRSEDFVRPYGNSGYFFSDPERYFFLNFAFVREPEVGRKVLHSLCEYFNQISGDLTGGYTELAKRGYYDALGSFEIERLHLQIYDSEREITDVLLSAFQRFSQWRSDPVFNHGLNRRLVKALRDHIRTGVIDGYSDLMIIDLMEYSTPPWSDRYQKKHKALAQAEPYAKEIPEVYPHFLLEKAKARAEISNSNEQEEVRMLFSKARDLFEKAELVYYVGESLRHEGKFLTSIDEFDAADGCFRDAISRLEKAIEHPGQYETTTYECWRLVAWNQFYAGGIGVGRAREIAEEKYSELKADGRRYMTSLFGILLSKVRAFDPDFFSFGSLFFDTLDILEESIQNLVAVPDSIDYPNALFQKLTLDIDYLEKGSATDEERRNMTSGLVDRIAETRLYYGNLNSEQGLANLSYWEGKLKFLIGDVEQAFAALQSALATFRKRSDRYGQFNTLFRLGVVHLSLGDRPSAVSALSEAWGISEQKNWQERYENNLSLAVLKNPSLKYGLTAADSEARAS